MPDVITYSPHSVQRSVKVAGKNVTDDRDAVSFVNQLGKVVPFSTGILPPGLISYRQAGQHAQIVLAMPPAVNTIMWGAKERDPKAKIYTVAQPWRIAIAELDKGNLLGCRLFYSPTPPVSEDTLLYHSNLPNTNCQGYRGNSVGWVCLYHKEDWSKLSLADIVNRIALRVGGNEAYNDANMPETDGPRFYRQQYVGQFGEQGAAKFSFLWNPTDWDARSVAEGFQWTISEDVWIPVQVAGIDSQDSHLTDGVPLTLGMAMNGRAKAYYYDASPLKLYNQLTRTETPVTPGLLYKEIIVPTFVKAPAVNPENMPGNLATIPDEAVTLDPGDLANKETVVKNTLINSIDVTTMLGTVSFPIDWKLSAGNFKIKWDKDGLISFAQKAHACSQCQYNEEPTTETPYHGYLCDDCYSSNYAQCFDCGELLCFSIEEKAKETFVVHGDWKCTDCAGDMSCPSCHVMRHDSSDFILHDSELVGCFECTKHWYCRRCGTKSSTKHTKPNVVKQPDPHEDLNFCDTCIQAITTCECCNVPKPNPYMRKINDQSICTACVKICPTCLKEVPKNLLHKDNKCKSCSDYTASSRKRYPKKK